MDLMHDGRRRSVLCSLLRTPTRRIDRWEEWFWPTSQLASSCYNTISEWIFSPEIRPLKLSPCTTHTDTLVQRKSLSKTKLSLSRLDPILWVQGMTQLCIESYLI
ncbi:uncharacterized protein YALI1_A16808g [Yarrowia lipolytica]|uniref:Uncharacterized protein n=1 Tax=Yarrowia lipolytica TaxID=4952 RepID=A0A1D8N539_YARLL|nr:hypothetical protein YALI1_A16808g [Yarrowia lipolytica]